MHVTPACLVALVMLWLLLLLMLMLLVLVLQVLLWWLRYHLVERQGLLGGR
jgi:hypothetical protein